MPPMAQRQRASIVGGGYPGPLFTVKPFPEGSLPQTFLEAKCQLLAMYLGPAKGGFLRVVMTTG